MKQLTIKDARQTLTAFILKNKDDKDVLEIVKEMLSHFKDYVNLVTEQDHLGTVLKYTIELEEYRDLFQRLDNRRHSVHNVIINDITIVNRLCIKQGLGKFYTGDITNRVAIGNFVGMYVYDGFKNRRK